MQDTRRLAAPLAAVLSLTFGASGAALAQEKPASAPPAQPADAPAPQDQAEPDPSAPTFSKPVVYTGGRVVERLPGDHVGVSRIGFVKDMQYSVPRGWIKEPPFDPQALAQFQVPGTPNTGIPNPLVVFYNHLDGSVNDILDIWLNELEEPKWTPEIEVWMLDLGFEHGLNITLFSGIGTYVGPPLAGGEAKPQPDCMLLGAIIEGSPKGTLYIKAVGNRNILEPDLGWWQRMIRSFKVTTPPADYRQPQPGAPGQSKTPTPPKPKTPASPSKPTDDEAPKAPSEAPKT